MHECRFSQLVINKRVLQVILCWFVVMFVANNFNLLVFFTTISKAIIIIQHYYLSGSPHLHRSSLNSPPQGEESISSDGTLERRKTGLKCTILQGCLQYVYMVYYSKITLFFLAL